MRLAFPSAYANALTPRSASLFSEKSADAAPLGARPADARPAGEPSFPSF